MKNIQEISSLKNPTVGKGTKILPSVKISSNAIIGKNCKISSGAEIGACKIGDNVYIGVKTRIYNGVVIDNNVKIEKYSVIMPLVFIGQSAIIESKCVIQARSFIKPGDKIGANSNYKYGKHILR